MKFLRRKTKLLTEKNQYFFRTLCHCLSLVGLWSFEVVYSPNGSIRGSRVRPFDCLRVLIAICIHSMQIYEFYEIIKNLLNQNEGVFFSTLVYYVVFIPLLVLGLVGIVTNLFVRNILINILTDLNKFDTKVGWFLNSMEFQKSYLYSLY